MVKDTSSEGAKNVNHRQLLQEERYLWMARAFILMTVLGLFANIALLIAISGAIPFLRVQPFFVHLQDKNDQVVSVERLSPEILSNRDLQEHLVRQYVMAYFGVGSDIEEYKRRTAPGGIIDLMSSASVFKVFQEMHAKPNMALIPEQNMTRDVIVRSAHQNPLKVQGNTIWTVSLGLVTKTQSLVDADERVIDVTLSINFEPEARISRDQRFKNPLGFKVKGVKTADNELETKRFKESRK